MSGWKSLIDKHNLSNGVKQYYIHVYVVLKIWKLNSERNLSFRLTYHIEDQIIAIRLFVMNELALIIIILLSLYLF